MSTTQIEDERRRGRIAGVATIVAGLLLGWAIVWSALINRDRPEGDNKQAEQLRFLHDRAGELIGVSAVRAVAFALMVFTIVFLYRATKARNQELSSVTTVAGLFGVAALAVGGIVQAVSLAHEASDFAGQSFPTLHAANEAAKDAAKEPLPLAGGIVAFAGTFGLALWFVMGSLNAMRVGLLTRFMGILGIIVGPGFLLGFALPVMVFWLVGVGVLFLGRWPSGLPPAWVTGEAVPWPGREDVAPVDEVVDVTPESPNGEVNAVGPGVHEPTEPEDGSQPGRRKRKRRS